MRDTHVRCRLKDAQAPSEPVGMTAQSSVAGATTTRVRASPDTDALACLLDEHFDGRPGLVEELPLLLGPTNRERCFVAEHDGAYLAHAAWRPLSLLSGTERVRAAAIGAVTTHGDARGRGLATHLVERCLEAAALEGCELALLFGTSRGLYARLGFVCAGRERLVELRPDPGVPRPGGARAGRVADAPRVLELLRGHAIRVDRGLAEIEQLLAVPGTRLHVIEESGHGVAYCVEGKGRDLARVIHEWAGHPARVAELMRWRASTPGGPLWALGPATLPAPVAGVEHLGTMAQLRILQPERFGGTDPVEIFGDAAHPARLPLYVWGLDSV